MAEILKADKEQKHSAPYYANKKDCPQSQTRNVGKHQTRTCIFLLSEIPIKLIDVPKN
jgi:hypothetical protein